MPKKEEDFLQENDDCEGYIGIAAIFKESEDKISLTSHVEVSQNFKTSATSDFENPQPSCSYDSSDTFNYEDECQTSCEEKLPPSEQISPDQDHKASSLQSSLDNWPLSIEEMKKRIGQQKGNFSKKSRKYYNSQLLLLKAYESYQVCGDLESGGSEREQKMKEMANKLAKITLIINLLLLFGNCAAAYLSGSLSLLYSVVDNAIDVVISIAIWYTNRIMSKKKIYLYPHGRKGLEPVTLIIVTVMMVMASLMVIEKAIEVLIHNHITIDIQAPTIAIICIGIGTKFILFMICRRYDNPSIKILVKEQRNEMIVNAVALACGFIGDKLWPKVDPIGAILINLYVLGNWCMSLKKNIYFLEGRAARPEFLNQIVWVCLHHDPRIVQINNVHACYFGTRFLVEVDIVLPKETALRVAHDVGEALQKKLETFTNVGFAFVHVDYLTNELPPPRRVKDKPF